MGKPRVGFGFDVHPLSEGREFYLGGMKINAFFGAAGHSDADVLIHAICDALLGAAGLRDIGFHFPDSDKQYKDIDSKILLREVTDKLHAEGYSIGNVDATVCLENPKISSFIPDILHSLAGIMKIPVRDISVKATTTEKLGFIGRNEGVAAYAVALIFAP